MTYPKQKADSDKGASLVEFAILAPLLITLVFGIIEFSWAFAQNIDVRHGAREGGRLAAVNFPTGPTNGLLPRTDAERDALVAEICTKMDTATSADVSLVSSGAVGDPAAITVRIPIDTLTGLFDSLLPPTLLLQSTVEVRVEQPATWSNAPAGSEVSC